MVQALGVDDALLDALLVASRALVAVAARSLAGEDVTLPQFRALVVLATRPGLSVNDLAEALGVHPSTATRLCDRLAGKRLVRRVPGTEDRRAIGLHLAARGRQVVQRVTNRRRTELATIAARLPAGMSQPVVDALTAFADAAGEPAGVDLFGWSGGKPTATTRG